MSSPSTRSPGAPRFRAGSGHAPTLRTPATRDGSLRERLPIRRITRVTPALTDAHVARLRGELLEQRAFRVEQLVELQTPGHPGRFGSADEEVFASLRAAARRALHEVSRALWRIEEGTYGRCTACDVPLDLERLEIVPQTALCMTCQREADELTRTVGLRAIG